MRKGLILAAMVATLASGAAYALVKTFSWTAPTTFVDGSVLPPSDITSFDFICTAAGQPSVMFTAAGTARTVPRDLPPGTWACSATATARGATSDPSNVVNFTILQPKPNPPVLSVD